VRDPLSSGQAHKSHSSSPSRPLVIAGPCMAESWETLVAVAQPLVALSRELDFDFVFKSSFDKANRTSIDSYRGPGIKQASEWFARLKKDFGVRILTDVHETTDCAPAADVCDVLQIPAFLCRQTDLLVAAVATGRAVNVKKGQFMAPRAMHNIVDKARAVCREKSLKEQIMLTERGVTFGYGNLVVDMRALAMMAEAKVPVIFDITHSTQLPASGGEGGKTSGGQRHFAPLLARSATASGYIDGWFLEVHPSPTSAKSDKDAQLTITQATTLLKQLVPLWHATRTARSIDSGFVD